ncbi:MAG: SWIM zinc finger family protein [Patescibacteria group bacterium]|nr:SWIM zinc finger family protein [Patescibacteria group bacterium]
MLEKIMPSNFENIRPYFDLDKIKFSTDEKTFQRAVGIYESRKIKEFHKVFKGFSAKVAGTTIYDVFVSMKDFNYADCNCYLGQKDYLCKHVVAVAIWAVMDGKKLSKEDKKQHNNLSFSGLVGEIDPNKIAELKKKITEASRYIKTYNGPSKIWFQYQNSLEEGCNRLSALFSQLPASKSSAKLVLDTLLKLDRKLSHGGVDDSNGTVGEFISSCVELLIDFRKADPSSAIAFKALKNTETCFGWEKPLIT